MSGVGARGRPKRKGSGKKGVWMEMLLQPSGGKLCIGKPYNTGSALCRTRSAGYSWFFSKASKSTIVLTSLSSVTVRRWLQRKCVRHSIFFFIFSRFWKVPAFPISHPFWVSGRMSFIFGQCRQQKWSSHRGWFPPKKQRFFFLSPCFLPLNTFSRTKHTNH